MSAVSATQVIFNLFVREVCLDRSTLRSAVANTKSFAELFKYLNLDPKAEGEDLFLFFMEMESTFPTLTANEQGVRISTEELLPWSTPYDDLLSQVSADSNWMFTPVHTYFDILPDTEWTLIAAGEANGKRYEALSAVRNGSTRYQFKVNKLLMVETGSLDKLFQEMGKLLGVENV